MRRPPLVLTFLSVLLLALGTSGGAVMSVFRLPIQRYATERIVAARELHNLSGSRDYDVEVVSEIVFTIEAGLSFFHTHAEGMGVILLVSSTVVSSLIARRWLRHALNAVIGLSFFFPLGYLAWGAFILRYGRDAGVALAEQLLLIPFGSSAILGLVMAAGAAAFSLVNGRGRRPAAPHDFGGWRRPPRVVVLAAALLIFLAEIGGASMGRFSSEIKAVARAWIVSQGAAHGLVGVRDVDDEIIDEALVKLDGGLRLFHLHAEGMGLVIFAGALVISTLITSPGMRRILYALLTVGGFGFPFGYLLWSVLISPLGIDRARLLAAALALIPFGASAMVALWILTVLLARDLFRGGAPVVGPPGSGTSGVEASQMPAEPRWIPLPPVSLVLASLVLLILAEVAGASMVKFKDSIERANRQRVEARADVHGLVGVRQVDGEIVDRALARADFALRLFHLHAEGMGLVIFAGGMMIRAFLASPSLSTALYAMLTGGAFVYPFGYLAWSVMIPGLGLDRSKDLAEYLVWIPFGGAALLATGIIAAVLTLDLVRSRRPGRK
jgi:hypothetical protein